MATYRKKPVIIEAEQFRGARPGQDTLEWIQGFPKGVCFKGCGGSKFPHLHTIHQGQVVDLADGDWVIPESDGEHFYPCKPDVFEATYEPI
jgi:hypothetical protein